jgi:hypothetical protein
MGKDPGIYYTVLLIIINLQSQDIVYNDFKDFCQYGAHIVNTIYREHLDNKIISFIKLYIKNLLDCLDVSTRREKNIYKLKTYHGLVLLIHSRMERDMDFNRYEQL